MFKKFEMELAGRTLRVDVGRVAAQANGAALMHYGETVVLSTATASEKPREGIDFFPLSVEYEEKLYAVGKIPGGFNKREGKASENAILTSRVIDRPMRPLFPKDYRNDVTLNNLVLSVDPDCSPELTAMLGSAIATAISDIPFDGPTSTTQVGMIGGEFVFNPNAAQRAVSDMQLTVASTRDKVIMIEAGANEVPEAKMIEAIFAAHEVNQEVIKFIDTIVAECGKEKHAYTSCAVPEELFAAMKEIVTPEEMEVAVFTDEKQVREENLRVIREKLEEAFAENEEWLEILGEALYQYQKKTVRKMILKDHKRPEQSIRSDRLLLRQISFREYMVLLCLHVDRHRFVQSQHWHLCQRLRELMGWMRQRLQKDICTTITSRHTQLERQNHQEDRDAVRLGMEHLRKEHLCRYFRQKKNFHMQSVLFLRHLSQMVLLHRQVSAHLVCH